MIWEAGIRERERDEADEGIQMPLNPNKEAEAVLFFNQLMGW